MTTHDDRVTTHMTTHDDRVTTHMTTMWLPMTTHRLLHPKIHHCGSHRLRWEMKMLSVVSRLTVLQSQTKPSISNCIRNYYIHIPIIPSSLITPTADRRLDLPPPSIFYSQSWYESKVSECNNGGGTVSNLNGFILVECCPLMPSICESIF